MQVIPKKMTRNLYKNLFSAEGHVSAHCCQRTNKMASVSHLLSKSHVSTDPKLKFWWQELWERHSPGCQPLRYRKGMRGSKWYWVNIKQSSTSLQGARRASVIHQWPSSSLPGQQKLLFVFHCLESGHLVWLQGNQGECAFSFSCCLVETREHLTHNLRRRWQIEMI